MYPYSTHYRLNIYLAILITNKKSWKSIFMKIGFLGKKIMVPKFRETAVEIE